MSGTLIIINPAARSEKARALFEKISQLSGADLVRTTAQPGDAKAMAARAVADGYHTIVAAGGDGTINEVVNGIGQADVALGVLPIGTMNVYAAELGLPAKSLRKCWEIVTDGHIRLVDLPLANKQYFVQLGGIGFDAQVVQETSVDFKRTLGPLSYVISATQIAARKPPRLVVEANGKHHSGSFVLIGNGRFYGGPFLFFKDALIDDGRLDVLVFKNIGYIDLVRYLHGVMFGTHMNLPDVKYFQARKIMVRSDQEVPVEVDGEVIGNLPVTFRIAPRKLSVLAPKK
ncbi:MAG: diacylglycerol kinase family lipid kinase [Verrucomicrobiota bacterium]|nr:diacylglycerol kinase family lipid kinase [Verrucomicrobiota bacterium]